MEELISIFKNARLTYYMDKSFFIRYLRCLGGFSGDTFQLWFDSTHNLDGVTINNE